MSKFKALGLLFLISVSSMLVAVFWMNFDPKKPGAYAFVKARSPLSKRGRESDFNNAFRNCSTKNETSENCKGTTVQSSAQTSTPNSQSAKLSTPASTGVKSLNFVATNSSGIPVKNKTMITNNFNDPLFKIKQKRKAGLPVSISTINMFTWLLKHMELSEECMGKMCVLTQGNITENTDVVVVLGNALPENSKPARWPGQLYVYLDREPPSISLTYSCVRKENSKWRYEFNLTSTYVTSSDVPWPYHIFRKISYKSAVDFIEVAKRKTKTAVWLVSSCTSQSNRGQYVKEMQKYIDVDIYGRCGNQSACKRGGTLTCMSELLSQYSFYLAFENSMCVDYVTEKSSKLYIDKNYIVPVVRGGPGYDTLLPKDSFIDAAKFQTPRDLALYLKSLRTDHVRYSEYLRKKEEYRFTYPENEFCAICRAVTTESVQPKRYDILNWLQGQCTPPGKIT